MRVRRIAIQAWVLALALCLPGVTRAEPEVDLIGSWYVLIHYRDIFTANPELDRWEDRLWVFEERGSRLSWTDYPIVVFADQDGRFGPVAGNPRARIMHAWEPNESQLSEIRAGLRVNDRGSKRKSLRGSMQKGYQSFRARRAVSFTTVGYEQTWSIGAPTSMPVFTRVDSLGTEASLAAKDEKAIASGVTRFRTTEVSSGGGILRGSYVRDQNRAGTFRMSRAGAPRGLESDGRTPNEKAAERFGE